MVLAFGCIDLHPLHRQTPFRAVFTPCALQITIAGGNRYATEAARERNRYFRDRATLLS